MGLSGALQIGRSALTVSQVGLQVVGNNMANATTPGYSRQTVAVVPTRGQSIGGGATIGRGVRLESIIRHVDEALQTRIRTALSNEESAIVRQEILAQLEALQNELSEADLSTALNDFFSVWSELANNPTDNAVRQLVIHQGVGLGDQIQELRFGYVGVRRQIDDQIAARVELANELLNQVASLNLTILQAEQGQGSAPSLRDQRDQLLEELSGFMDINVVEQRNGVVDVFVGSLPVVLGTNSRGIETRQETVGGALEISVRIKDDGSELSITSGSIGSLLSARENTVSQSLDDLDELAAALIFEINRVHSQGQGTAGFSSVQGTYRVADPDLALNDAGTELPFTIVNGSFLFHVTHEDTQARITYKIDIDLDGIGPDTTLNDLAAQINAAAAGSGITATVTAGGRLQLDAPSGFTMSFSDDTAGVLAGLGINTYFTGKDASDIAVNGILLNDSTHLATGLDHVAGSNGTAMLIKGLEYEPVGSLNGSSLTDFWIRSVEELAVGLDTANSRLTSASLVRESLQAQEAAVSGVSLDEEAINLLNYQRQFQAAARFITVIDELMQTLLNMV